MSEGPHNFEFRKEKPTLANLVREIPEKIRRLEGEQVYKDLPINFTLDLDGETVDIRTFPAEVIINYLQYWLESYRDTVDEQERENLIREDKHIGAYLVRANQILEEAEAEANAQTKH